MLFDRGKLGPRTPGGCKLPQPQLCQAPRHHAPPPRLIVDAVPPIIPGPRQQGAAHSGGALGKDGPGAGLEPSGVPPRTENLRHISINS